MRWLNSTNCQPSDWDTVRMCAGDDGVVTIDSTYYGSKLPAGSYILFVQAANYEGDWIEFELFEGESVSYSEALKPKAVMISMSGNIGSDGMMKLGFSLWSTNLRSTRIDLYVTPQGPGVTESYINEQSAVVARSRTIGRKQITIPPIRARFDPNVPDGNVYCFVAVAKKAGALAFGEVVGISWYCIPKGDAHPGIPSTSGGGGGGKG